jgi:hypothetical protein
MDFPVVGTTPIRGYLVAPSTQVRAQFAPGDRSTRDSDGEVASVLVMDSRPAFPDVPGISRRGLVAPWIPATGSVRGTPIRDFPQAPITDSRPFLPVHRAHPVISRGTLHIQTRDYPAAPLAIRSTPSGSPTRTSSLDRDFPVSPERSGLPWSAFPSPRAVSFWRTSLGWAIATSRWSSSLTRGSLVAALLRPRARSK